MNWTGGRLSRSTHRNRKAGTLSSRQRQHFAKIHINLRNGTKRNSPHEFSILGNIIEDHRQHLDFNDGREENREGRQLVRQHSARPSARSISRSIVPAASRQKRIRNVKLEDDDGSGDDLYSATPQPPTARRKTETPLARKEILSEEEVIARKRRRLLLKGDWVGTSIQQPMELRFTYPVHGENVGRRRKITDGHRARYSAKQTAISSPFVTRKLIQSPYNSRTHDQGRELGRSDVRISIGGRVVPPGISSSTEPSRRHRTSDHSRLLDHTPRASSDVMLLDNEGVSKRYEKLGWVQLSDRHGEDRGLSSGSLEYSIDGEQPKLHESLRGSGSLLDTNSKYSPLRPKRVTGVPRKSATSGSPIPGVFTSSSASMHHPKPQSSKVSALLRSDTSDNAESTFAHVGKIKPAVPSSQALENEVWETWMAPLKDDEEESAVENSSDPQDSERGISISPGCECSTTHFPWWSIKSCPESHQISLPAVRNS